MKFSNLFDTDDIPAFALPKDTAFRFVPIHDIFEPTFRSGSAFIITPCRSFIEDGIYALRDGGDGEDYRRAQRRGEMIHLSLDNPLYRDSYAGRLVTLAWFNAHVVGRAISFIMRMG